MLKLESAIIAHQYPLDRLAIRGVIRDQHPDIKITEAINWPELITTLNNDQKFELLLLDLSLLTTKSLTALKNLLRHHSYLKAITISRHQHKISKQQFKRSGIAGNITSRDTPQTLIQALDEVLKSNSWFSEPTRHSNSQQVASERFKLLTKREWRVLSLLDQGMMNKQIAGELHLSVHTAKLHVCTIMRKLEVNTRTLAVLAYRNKQLADRPLRLN
ncbi:MAG: response regulator transcription factor [Motiliproteus sp.]